MSQNTETEGATSPDEFSSLVKFAETTQVPLYISITRKKGQIDQKTCSVTTSIIDLGASDKV